MDYRDVAYGGHEEDGEHKMGEHRCPAIWRGETRLRGTCTWPACKDANGVCAYAPPPRPTTSLSDPVTALVQLRAEMVRIAHEVEALADLDSIRVVRAKAPDIAKKMRNAAMTHEMEQASQRQPA